MNKAALKIGFGIVLLGASLGACGTAGPTYREERIAAQLDNRGQYLEDQGITSKVAAVFTAEPRFRGAQIHVTTVDNVVALSGFVSNGSDIGYAEDLTLSVEGVRGVANRLTVN